MFSGPALGQHSFLKLASAAAAAVAQVCHTVAMWAASRRLARVAMAASTGASKAATHPSTKKPACRMPSKICITLGLVSVRDAMSAENGLFGGGAQADATMTHATLSLSDRDIRQVATEHARQHGALQGIVPVSERGVQDVAPAQGQLGGRILEVGVKLLVHLFNVPNHDAQHLKRRVGELQWLVLSVCMSVFMSVMYVCMYVCLFVCLFVHM